MLIQEIYSCGSGKLIQSSRIDAILSASEIRQDEIRLHPELSDGTTFVRCHKNCVSKYVSPSTLANMSKRVNGDNKSVTLKLKQSECAQARLVLLNLGSTVCSALRSLLVSCCMRLLDICQKRGDDLGKTGSAPIHGSPSDLHAADARYHSKSNQSFHHDAHRPNETGDKYSADDCAFSETVNVLSSDRSKRTDFTTHSQSKLQPLLKGRNVYMLVRVQS